MSGLTVSQQERLISLRRRRNNILEDIESLRGCERNMINIRGQIQSQNANFGSNSQLNQSEWRGSTGSKYNNHRNEIRSNATAYHSELGAMITRVADQRSNLSRESINVNNAIRDLERIARTGGV